MMHPARDLLILAGEFSELPDEREGYVVRALPGWDALKELILSAAPSTVVLIRADETDATAVEEVIRASPSVPVVAAVPFARVTAMRMRALLDAGIAEIANADGDVPLAALLPTLRRAHARPLKRRIEAGLPVWLPEEARTLLRAAAETAVDRGGRERFAEIFGLYERTIAEKCAELGLPTPRRLLGWVRVLLALSMLEERHRTVMNVALACGYTDNTSLKRAVENFTGSAMLASVRDMAFAAALERFAEELRRLRHEAPRLRSGARF